MPYRTWLEIDKTAIVHNLAEIKRIIHPRVKIMAVVKANAYGHGLIEVARLAQKAGAEWLGVDSVEEGVILRKADLNLPILVMGYVLKKDLEQATSNNLSFAVYNLETIFELSKRNLPAKIHLKIETGTMRQGIFLKDLSSVIGLIKKSSHIKIEGIYTHFANIEDTADHSFAKKQLQEFKKALKIAKENSVSPVAHTACSAAAILFPETHFDMIRLGLSMYGLWSSPQTFVSAKNLKKSLILKPALSWKTKIAQIKKVKAGTPIGYGLTEKTSQDTKIAVLPTGYWDGLDRKLSSIGNVLIGGRRCKIMGRICMNMCMVDINHLPDVSLEDEAVFLGKQEQEQITAEEIAQKIGTINYEIIARINPLIPRIYK